MQFFQSYLKKKSVRKNLGLTITATLCLAPIGLLRSPKNIKCVWESQLIRQAQGFSLQKALSQLVSVVGILRKGGKNYKGFRDKVAFCFMYFSKSKKPMSKTLTPY